MSFGQVEEIASNIGFTEGPIWRLNQTLVVTSINRGLLYEIEPKTKAIKTLVETGGGPNGLAEDADGVIWVAQNGGHAFRSKSERPTPAGVQRVSTGGVDDVAWGFHAPNDCAIGPDGRLWFTDPRGNALDESPTPGRLGALDRSSGEVEIVLDGPLYPNGLAFDEKGKYLYVAETTRRRILRYPLDNGTPLKAPEVFVSFPTGMPDGIAFDEKGRLYVVLTFDAAEIAVVDLAGNIEETIKLEENCVPTNLCFGGEDFRTIFVTIGRGGRVVQLHSDVPGLTLCN